MIWAGLKSVRGAMFREMESRVTMETRLWVQPYSGILNLFLWELYNKPDRHQKLQSIPAGLCENQAVAFLRSRIQLPDSVPRRWRRTCCNVMICLSVHPDAANFLKKTGIQTFFLFFFFFLLPAPLAAYQNSLWLQTLSEHMWVPAWVCMYFPHGCSRSPLNKAAVLLLSKPTSFVSNEHLPGSFPTTAGFSVSPCQQPMTLICSFITPKRCVCLYVCAESMGCCKSLAEWLLRVLHKQCVFGIHRCVWIGIDGAIMSQRGLLQPLTLFALDKFC